MIKNKTVAIDIISGLFILLFMYAALSKVLDFQKFNVQIGKSPLLSPFSHWIAWLIPSIEITIAILLLLKRVQLIALYASFCLMIIFSAYIIAILNFSEYIPCSCGGILENMTWIQHFWFNILFVILSAVSVLLFPYKDKEIIGQ